MARSYRNNATISIIVLAVAAVATAAVIIAVLAPRGTPQILLTPESMHVIAETDQPSIDAAYNIKNLGSTNLSIEDVETGCGCSVAFVDPKVIAPGQVGTIVINATVPPTGGRDLDILVHTDNKEHKTIPLKLTVASKLTTPHLVYSTPVLQFGTIADSSQVEFVALQTAEHANSKPWVNHVVCSDDNLAVELEGIDEDYGTGPGVVMRVYRYRVQFNQKPPPGSVWETIAFKKNEKAKSEIAVISVRGKVHPIIHAMPSTLYIINSSGQDKLTGHLKFVGDGVNSQTNIKYVDSDLKLVVEQSSDTSNGIVYNITVCDFGSNFEGILVFETNIPEHERIEVPLRYINSKKE